MKRQYENEGITSERESACPVERTVKAKQESESKLESCNHQRKTDVGKHAV